jgi:hypothetical protein
MRCITKEAARAAKENIVASSRYYDDNQSIQPKKVNGKTRRELQKLAKCDLFIQETQNDRLLQFGD